MKRPTFRRRARPGTPKGRDRVLITPEGIALPVTLATRGARVGALLLDLFIIFVSVVACTIAILTMAGGLSGLDGGILGGGDGAQAMQFLAIIWIIGLFLSRYTYFLAFELGPRGATPGKRLAGIRIAAQDGGRLSPEMVIARNLLRDIELFLPIPLIVMGGVDSGAAWAAAAGGFMIFMALPLFNRDHLRAGDIVAGSWVIERPREKLQAAMTARVDEEAVPRVHYHFTAEELAIYGEYELQTLERILRDRRSDAIDPVYQTIAAKIGRHDGWNDEHRFLSDYYTQLRERLEAGMRMGRRKANKHT